MHILFETNALGVHDGCVAQILCTKGTARLITFSIPTSNFGGSYALEPQLLCFCWAKVLSESELDLQMFFQSWIELGKEYIL